MSAEEPGGKLPGRNEDCDAPDSHALDFRSVGAERDGDIAGPSHVEAVEASKVGSLLRSDEIVMEEIRSEGTACAAGGGILENAKARSKHAGVGTGILAIGFSDKGDYSTLGNSHRIEGLLDACAIEDDGIDRLS